MTHTGTVKGFGAQKGFGFITCPEVEGDIFFGHRDLPAELQGQDIPLKDCTVHFELQHGPDGRPQAKQVQVEGTFAGAGGTPGEDTYSGEIKSFNAAKGFGFLACQTLEGDVYFQARDIPAHLQIAPLVGMRGTFNVHVTQDGKNQARNMKLAQGGMGGMKGGKGGGKAPTGYGGPPAPQGAYMAMSKGAAYGASAAKGGWGPFDDPYGKGGAYGGCGAYGGGMCKGGYGGPPPPGYGGPPPPMMGGGGGPPDGATVFGTIKSADTNKGFGFINVAGINTDVYFKLDNQGLEAGQKVTFVIKWMKDGKPQGRDLTLALNGGEALIGTIKTYSEKNTYGFLTTECTPQDIYFQKRSLPMELQNGTSAELQGLSVQFTVELKPDGKPQALEIVQADGSAPAAPSRGAKRPAGEMNGGQIAPSKYPRLGAAPAAKGGCKGAAKGCGKGQSVEGGTMLEGMIKSFNSAKGFGFVESAAVPGDIYFKATMLPPHLQNTDLQGAQAQFELRYTPDGKPQASGIQVEGA